jgi:hypothetical protein
MEYDIHVALIPSNSPHAPVVRYVFLMLAIMRLSPEGCNRTFVKSSGL